MSAAKSQAGRAQSLGEEIANSISHAAALVGVIVGSPFLLVAAARQGDPAFIVGASVFCAAMILLYSTSTLYHALGQGRLKRLLRVLDHSAIFVLIAGTYTPFTLGVLRDSAGWPLFATVWALALLGIGLKAFGRVDHPMVSTGLYLAMGWVVLLALDALVAAVPPAGLAWLVAGGLAYTLGIIFYLTDERLRYGHTVWHAFVVGGTACHYFAVLWFAA